MAPLRRRHPRAIQLATHERMPSTMYFESVVKTTRKLNSIFVNSENASITERSAMRLLVVAGSDIQ